MTLIYKRKLWSSNEAKNKKEKKMMGRPNKIKSMELQDERRGDGEDKYRTSKVTET